MISLVLINAAANHFARTDRCLPNRELANIFQTLALTSWFTLQTVLSKWQFPFPRIRRILSICRDISRILFLFIYLFFLYAKDR